MYLIIASSSSSVIFFELAWVSCRARLPFILSRRVVSGTLYTFAAPRTLRPLWFLIAWIAICNRPSSEVESIMHCGKKVVSKLDRVYLGGSARLACVRGSLVYYVNRFILKRTRVLE